MNKIQLLTTVWWKGNITMHFQMLNWNKFSINCYLLIVCFLQRTYRRKLYCCSACWWRLRKWFCFTCSQETLPWDSGNVLSQVSLYFNINQKYPFPFKSFLLIIIVNHPSLFYIPVSLTFFPLFFFPLFSLFLIFINFTCCWSFTRLHFGRKSFHVNDGESENIEIWNFVLLSVFPAQFRWLLSFEHTWEDFFVLVQ